MVCDTEKYAARMRTSGTILKGSWVAAAIPGYVAGPNHGLPTAGSARYPAALSVQDYSRGVTLPCIDEGAFRMLGPNAAILARAEGLVGQARSIETRINRYEA